MQDYDALSWYALDGVQKDRFLNLGTLINWQRFTEDGVEFPMLYLVVSGAAKFTEGRNGVSGVLGDEQTFNAIFVPTGLGYRIRPLGKGATAFYLYEPDKINAVLAEAESIHK